MVSKFEHLSLGQSTYSALLYPQCESVTSKKKTKHPTEKEKERSVEKNMI